MRTEIEVAGVDVTSRRIPRDGFVVESSLGYPQLVDSRTSAIAFNLDNSDGDFDYSEPENFFVRAGKQSHGRGASVLIRINDIVVFAGVVSDVVTRLGDTKALIKARDLNIRLIDAEVLDFGQELTRRITDFDGATADYDEFDPVFYFPQWGRPVARDSVSITLHAADGDVAINVVDSIAISGTLSNRNAEIDYDRSLIRFEAPPLDAASTEITVTWKVDYKYKRPDFLARQLVKSVGIQSDLGITDDMRARFAIDESLLRVDERVFSTHGRPFPSQSGVVRWMRRSGTKWQMIQDDRFVEYDWYQDEYTEVSRLPSEGGLDGIVNTNYGMYLPGESFSVDATAEAGVAVDVEARRIYVLESRNQAAIGVFSHTFDGSQVTGENVRFTGIAATGSFGNGLALDDTYFYVAQRVVDAYVLRRYRRDTGAIDRSYGGFAATLVSLDFTASRIISSANSITSLRIHDLDGNRQTAEEATFRTALTARNLGSGIRAVATNDSHIFVQFERNSFREIRAFTHAYVYDSAMDITLRVDGGSGDSGLAASNTRLYVLTESTDANVDNTVDVYQLGTAINFGNYVPYQFDTLDDDNFFFISTNNTQGNAVSTSTLRKVNVYKYVRSTNVWSEILNLGMGQPQLSQPYKFSDQSPVYLANNEKNFEAVERDGDTLVFFRFASSSAAGIRYRNDTDGSLTTVYNELYSGVENFGLPYSMDFALDSRTDGIYVYTFVVRHELDGSGNYAGGNLKVYRKRVEPDGTQAEIYSETFTQSTDEEDYAVSVSSLMLAEDRSKFYFVLQFHGEGERPGKVELCSIAKDGSGSRAVLKTYENPLVGSRSPVEWNGSYYYLEGGWVRRGRDPDTTEETFSDDQYHYPNEGGHLIEIDSSDMIVDHGQVWRTGTKDNSPDVDDPIYDGWGLFNAAISNIVVDGRGNFHFIAGFGSPYNVIENLPFSSNREPVPDLRNFHWIQWGQDLSTKIDSFETAGKSAGPLIRQLAEGMNWEMGFGPYSGKVAAVQAADSSISLWGASASLFFRPRTIQPASLVDAVLTASTVTTLRLRGQGLPADETEFPVPPAGDPPNYVIIDREMFSYTGVTAQTGGVLQLTGVVRAVRSSVEADHAVGANVYFVDYFASGHVENRLVGIGSRSLDFRNLRNDVSIQFGTRFYTGTDETSVDLYGKKRFSAAGSLLSRFDRDWAKEVGDQYLDLLSTLKETLRVRLVFSPEVRVSQLLVLFQTDRLNIDFKLFRVTQVRHQTYPEWKTYVSLREV